MKGKKLLSLLLCGALCLGLLPAHVFAQGSTAQIQNGTANLQVNTSKVAFAGHEWWVIGDENRGIYPNPDSITLLAKNKTIYSNDFKTTQFGVENSNYSGSVLQNKMEEIANSFPEKEQGLINLRTLQGGGTSKEPSVDGIAGDTVPDQKLWALSETERSAINEINVQKYNYAFWLRSPSGDRWAEIGNGSGTITGLVPFVEVTRDISIRPALSLNLSSVLFTTANNGKSSASVGGNLIDVSSPAGTVKFTVKDSSMSLNITDTGAKTVSAGDTLSLAYTNATTGTNQYVSCILTDSAGAVKYYGKLADCSQSEAANGTLSIPLSGVAGGNYKLYLFSEQANGNLYTDFCSKPVGIDLTVHEHSWSTEWNSDGTYHWHECTAGNCPITDNSKKGGYGEHSLNYTDNENGTHTVKCDVCEYQGQPQEHNFDQEIADENYEASPATCTEPAKYYKSCVCGEKGTEIFEIGQAAGHSMTYHEAVAATCTVPGNVEYWHCSTCSLNFADEQGQQPLNNTEIPAGHNAEKVDRVEPTATETGNIEYWYCPECDKYFANEALTEEITKEKTVLAATGTTDETSNPEENPKDPETKPEDKPADDVPQTGDTSNPALWVVLLLLASGSMAGIALYARKRKTN